MTPLWQVKFNEKDFCLIRGKWWFGILLQKGKDRTKNGSLGGYKLLASNYCSNSDQAKAFFSLEINLFFFFQRTKTSAQNLLRG